MQIPRSVPPPAPDFFLDPSRGASTTKFRSNSSQLGQRASGSQSPKSNKKQAPDGVQEFPSEWVGSTSPCRPEEVPLPLSPAQARASLADYPVVWKDRRRDVKLLMEDRFDTFPAGTSRWLRWLCKVSADGDPQWRVTPGPSLDNGEFDLLESEDEAEVKADKDEDYNPHQDQDDGVDDEGEIPDDASDDGVLNVAQRTTKRRRMSQSSAGVSTPKKVMTKSPVKTKVKVGLSGRSKSGSGSSKKPKPKSGGSRLRNSSTATILAVKGPLHLDAEECRAIESPGLGITSWMYFGVRMKPGDATAHAPFQTQGFPDFVPNRHDLDILKERCDGEATQEGRSGSVWNEPGLWKFPKRISYWVPTRRSHTKPGADPNYSLKEQVELLDAREPARLQWRACPSDEERITHLPEEVRRKLVPSGQRDFLDD
ncbi:unnamed protein product [Phytophthora fragariaefolia]|uniref:Unnamed protein product n=1 Tax=Phytophthora fragariaefolia TaxID=1490495 RepID=A0A9W6XJZ6_9STRA|nr:unnamed protein product [Phytophthora fragariaefolia]